MITVLLAAWNGAPFIEEQLDSILGQTICVGQTDMKSGRNPAEKDLQMGIASKEEQLRIIISDDGSGDGTREILERYCARYPDQVILNHRSAERKAKDLADGIPAAAGNFFWLLSQAVEDKHICDSGCEGTSGLPGGTGREGINGLPSGIGREGEDYYMLSDQDDVWKPNKIEVLFKEMKRLEAQHGTDHPILVHSDMEVVDAKLKVIHPSFFKYQKCDPSRVGFSELLAENSVTGGAVMMNRALVELLKERPGSCFMHDWWIALAASCFGTISCVREPLYLYRQHGHNTLGAKETGSVKDVAERLDRSAQVEENYRRMTAQAHAFGNMYHEKMSGEQKAVLRAYLALRYQSPMGRLKNIWRNRFFKSSKLQTIAQCVTIPRPDGGNWPV